MEVWRIAILLKHSQRASLTMFQETIKGGFADATIAALEDVTGVRRVILSLPPEQADPQVSRIFPTRHDALLEIWCDSASAAQDAARALSGSEAAATVLGAIADSEQGMAWLSEVHPEKTDDRELGKFKFLTGGDIQDGWSLDEAQRYWRVEHVRLAKTVPSVWSRIQRYTQFHGRPEAALEIATWLARTVFLPMNADLGFSKPTDFVECFSDPEYLRLVRPDEQKFGKPGEMIAFMTDCERTIMSR